MAEYRTRDLPLAAFLTLRGHASETEQVDGSVWFLFPDEARGDKEAFFGGAEVEAKGYAAAMKALKARVYWQQGGR